MRIGSFLLLTNPERFTFPRESEKMLNLNNTDVTLPLSVDWLIRQETVAFWSTRILQIKGNPNSLPSDRKQIQPSMSSQKNNSTFCKSEWNTECVGRQYGHLVSNGGCFLPMDQKTTQKSEKTIIVQAIPSAMYDWFFHLSKKKHYLPGALKKGNNVIRKTERKLPSTLVESAPWFDSHNVTSEGAKRIERSPWSLKAQGSTPSMTLLCEFNRVFGAIGTSVCMKMCNTHNQCAWRRGGMQTTWLVNIYSANWNLWRTQTRCRLQSMIPLPEVRFTPFQKESIRQTSIDFLNLIKNFASKGKITENKGWKRQLLETLLMYRATDLLQLRDVFLRSGKNFVRVSVSFRLSLIKPEFFNQALYFLSNSLDVLSVVKLAGGEETGNGRLQGWSGYFWWFKIAQPTEWCDSMWSLFLPGLKFIDQFPLPSLRGPPPLFVLSLLPDEPH